MHNNQEVETEQLIGLTQEQIEMLGTPPAPEDYTIRADNKKYLKIEYFRDKADQIFGPGRWSVYQDIETRWRVIRHPVTEKVIGETCSAGVTFRGDGCLPISAVGTVQVQFARNKTTGEILPDQSDQIYLIAERAAKARAFKDALAYLGPAFVCEIKPKTSNYSKGTSSYNKVSQHHPVISTQTTEVRQEPRNIRPVPVPAQAMVQPSNDGDDVYNEPMTQEQLGEIKKIATSKGYTIEAIENSALKLFNDKLASLTSEQAEDLITRLNEAPPAKTKKATSN